ncbi:MAG: prevent-host-death protein [Cyclobacteriaceae bacterium]|nr:prevent-host-death protein [Cyclobacteriaceae bacterium]
MKTVTVGEFKSKFTYYLEKVMKGEEFIVAYGRKKKKVALFSPYANKKRPLRKLGPLDGKVTIQISDDWEMSDEELINA